MMCYFLCFCSGKSTVNVICVHFNTVCDSGAYLWEQIGRAAQSWMESRHKLNSVGSGGKTSEEGKKIYCNLFLLCPLTSPVSPIVLYHNGGCLIILKTTDYQSSRFQGPNWKHTQQYRTERKFLWTVWSPADFKGHGFTDTPSLYIYIHIHIPKTHRKDYASQDCGHEWWGVQGMGCIPNIWLVIGKRGSARVGFLPLKNVPACFLPSGVSVGMCAWPG